MVQTASVSMAVQQPYISLSKMQGLVLLGFSAQEIIGCRICGQQRAESYFNVL